MAARSDYRPVPLPTPLVDLRDLRPEHLDALLREEGQEWFQELDWDFEPSANLVRRFIGMRSLMGYVLPGEDRSSPCGYAYYVADDGKGLVGGLYVSPTHRTQENENRLLTAVLDALWKTPGLNRVESQLMLLDSPLDRPVPYASRFRLHKRMLMEASLAHIATLPPRDPSMVIAPWSDNRRADAARLISAAYAGHVDSQINDQYRSPGGARRFLSNIVEYPGCGAFFAPASYVALLGHGKGLAGMSLASIVAPGVGHITQACVVPSHQGTGLGYELLRRSLVTLAAHGCHKTSLTVTSSNTEAVSLYRRMGFMTRREFAAYVWETR
jgi:ribosomal protein S18 acetylase RimI-like enzyme